MVDTKKTILIVEDEEALLKILEKKFANEGFSILKGKNGEEGLNLALKKKPDLVLLDILMPKMDGLEMLRRLRDDEWGEEVPVFLLTNLSEMEKISEAVQIGISGYLVKTDWKLDEVVAKVKERLTEEPKS